MAWASLDDESGYRVDGMCQLGFSMGIPTGWPGQCGVRFGFRLDGLGRTGDQIEIQIEWPGQAWGSEKLYRAMLLIGGVRQMLLPGKNWTSSIGEGTSPGLSGKACCRATEPLSGKLVHRVLAGNNGLSGTRRRQRANPILKRYIVNGSPSEAR